MKKIITLVLFFVISGCNKAATTPPPDYDLLVNDVVTVGEINAGIVLFNPENMRIEYIFNPRMVYGEAYEPGSIIKLLTSIAYFQSHSPFTYTTNGNYFVHPIDREAIKKGQRIRERRKISSRTYPVFRGDFFPDGGMCPRGEVNFINAFAHSSNSYFLEMITRMDFNVWYQLGKTVGFGEKTGLENPLNAQTGSTHASAPADNSPRPAYLVAGDIPESAGEFAFKNTFNKLMCAIGLGPQLKITALQYAVFLASVFNGGKIMKPIYRGQTAQVIRRYQIPQNLELIYKALSETSLSGTGRGFTITGADAVYSKSGSTMQHKKPYKPNGWFAGVVKAKNRYLGFVCLVESRTSSTAKHLVALLLRSYIKNSLTVER